MTSVLIVEDEESLADPLAFLLRKEGFEATVVTDGPAALGEFDRAGADIVLLDLMLPGMSGTQHFFQVAGRPFCLYVVVGSHRTRGPLVRAANDVVRTIRVDPR